MKFGLYLTDRQRRVLAETMRKDARLRQRKLSFRERKMVTHLAPEKIRLRTAAFNTLDIMRMRHNDYLERIGA